MLIGVPLETAAGEKRVATVPDVVQKLVKLGFSVAVQSSAGAAANFDDDTYRAAGAQVVGGNVRAAKVAGLSLGKIIIITCMIAGGMAGLAGAIEVAAVQGSANATLVAGYGYTGILVAFLALEIASLSLYVLAGFDKSKPESAEAALKFTP